MDEDIRAITRATSDWVASFKAGDVPGSAAVVTEDVVLIPPNQPEVVGREALEAWVSSLFEAIEVEEASATVDEVRVAGDWAVSRGTWQMSGSAGGAPMSDTTRYVLIWERHNGSWKIAYDLWNSSLPADGG